MNHHSVKPAMQFSSQLITTGTETQINLKPKISYTTKDAISSLSPKERGCYADGEANLSYVPYRWGFRYDMSNCLFDQGIRDVIWNCRCIPLFGYDISHYSAFIPSCSGEKLNCANKRMISLLKVDTNSN